LELVKSREDRREVHGPQKHWDLCHGLFDVCVNPSLATVFKGVQDRAINVLSKAVLCV